jgi:hypothetical protein
MTIRDEAINAFRELRQSFEEKKKKRIAFMGDGRGVSTSNLIFPDDNAFVYVRDQLNSTRYRPVRLNRDVRPAFNIPVEVELLPTGEERIIGISDTWLSRETAASNISGVPPHNVQHRFGGGDEVFIDDRLIKVGLVKPTAPQSMSVDVFPFVYYTTEWKRFPATTSADLSVYKPNVGNRYLLITVDPETNELLYVPGLPFTLNFEESLDISSDFSRIPSPPGDVIPLAAVLLSPTTQFIDWRSGFVDNLLSMRMFLSAPQAKIEDRLRAIEGYLGNDPSLPATGAQGFLTDDFIPGIIDGGSW